ncbi:diguanylate cyclase [Arcobacter sp. LA11]|uniref:transporter substrate-binding domain-containing diguanylate cyclase n=1 Tax=Arcobacter sp. LA11 TaxID=1898176 RepID=UPI0009F826E8|nr:diguanylate cyclase [Arcobacter sp. LA11]
MHKRILFILFVLFSNILYADKNLIQDDYIKLTPEEAIFLKNTKINVITSNTWAPINMYNDNEELSGIAIDFWKLIKSRAEINSSISISKDWNDVLTKIKNKEADITLGTSFDKEKLSYAKFSTPYISFPIAFATLFDKRFIPDASFLQGLKVAVGENYSSHIVLKNEYPSINFITVKNTEEALKRLSAGEVDAVIDILPVVAHLISKNGYSNLKISGTSRNNIEISFMVRKDYPELVQVINRHISLLTPDDKNKIIREWLTVKFDKRIIDKHMMINIIIIIIALLVLYIIRQRSANKYNEQLEFLSNTDALTGLKNRRKIDKILNKIKNKKFSLILMDIDHFKLINDDFGHLLGDEVLKNVAHILKYNVNQNDIIGRWGGEEFLIICKNTSISEAEKLSYRIKDLIENYDFKVRKITASFGVSEAHNNLELKDILANADKALYKAKENGRNQVILSTKN